MSGSRSGSSGQGRKQEGSERCGGVESRSREAGSRGEGDKGWWGTGRGGRSRWICDFIMARQYVTLPELVEEPVGTSFRRRHEPFKDGIRFLFNEK